MSFNISDEAINFLAENRGLALNEKLEAARSVLESSFEPQLFAQAVASTGSVTDAARRDVLGFLISSGISYGKDLENESSGFAAFQSIFQSLESNRSTFLPIEVFATSGAANTTGSGLFDSSLVSEGVAEQQSEFESYENCFMRMLGMPSTEDLGEGGDFYNITADGDVVIINTGDLMTILSERQLPSDLRAVTIGDKFFSFAITSPSESIPAAHRALYEQSVDEYGTRRDQASASLTTGEPQELPPAQDGEVQESVVSTLFGIWQEIVTENGLASKVGSGLLTEIFYQQLSPNAGSAQKNVLSVTDPSNFYRFPSMLTPPVQDGSIARCVNEPSKIVASKFLPQSQRLVNGKKVRSSFLEAVIRLRLDKVSGINPTLSETDEFGSVDQESFANLQDSWGVLESLIVARLESAIHGMAVYLRNNIKNMKINAQRTKKSVAASRQQSSNSASSFREFEESFSPNISNGATQKAAEKFLYETIVSIEDAMSLFFADNSQAYEESTSSQRGSSMINAYLMDAVMSIVEKPGNAARKRVKELSESQTRRAEKGTDRYQTNVSTILGDVKGVGVIDVAVYMLSLFTLPESYLLGLLNSQEVENMKSQYPSGFFDDFIIKNSMGQGLSWGTSPAMQASVNELTILLYINYEKFRTSISQSSNFYFGGRVIGS
mgnify:FL=1